MADDYNAKKAIFIFDKKQNLLKFFKIWQLNGNYDHLKIEITFKENGEKKKIVKEYKGYKYKWNKTEGHHSAACQCSQAIVKYWPKFDPEKHVMADSVGHVHTVVKVKKKKDKKKGLKK